MKKNLVLLTGIVFVLAILIAGSCGNSTKKDSPPQVPDPPKALAADVNDSTTVKVYLKEIVIGGNMHLLMSDSRKCGFEVIDGLITDVNIGDTVLFMKGKQSRISGVEKIDLLENVFGVSKEKFITEADTVTREVVYYRLIVDSHILEQDSIVKYEIHFTVRNHKDTIYEIDPYLRLPKEQ